MASLAKARTFQDSPQPGLELVEGKLRSAWYKVDPQYMMVG